MRAAFLGRFQPFHRGHHRVVSEYEAEYDLVVALGSPGKSRTPENPLTASERERLLDACHPDVPVVRVADEDRGEAGYPVWTKRLVRSTNADAVISQNDLVKRLVREHTSARVVEQDLHAPERFSGTEIRRRIRAGEQWRDLVPDCCVSLVAEYADVIRHTG